MKDVFNLHPPKPKLTPVFFFFYQYIIAHTFKNTKTLSPGTNILGVPGKKQKEILIKKLTKTN